MRAIWKGAISFGLVSVPVAVYSATRSEEIKFRLLREKDFSPINYKRVAEVDGKEVAWEEIVKGYEYEKGKFVAMKDEDFERVDLPATQTIDLLDFVPLHEIDPVYFMKPYYLEPQRGGAGAYGLLRDVLAKTEKAGIAKVIIKTRQHLAAVKAREDVLVLELMHFSDEVTNPQALNVPKEKIAGTRELEMARTLVDQMTVPWQPDRYVDEYHAALMKVIDEKIASGGRELPLPKRTERAATNVVDLVAVLQQSLDRAGQGRKPATPSPGRRAGRSERTAPTRASAARRRATRSPSENPEARPKRRHPAA